MTLSVHTVALFALTCTASAAAPPDPLIQLDSLRGGLDTHLIIGNGDLMAFIEQDGGDLVIGTSKNDVWDIRLETDQDLPLVPIKEIVDVAHNGKDGLSPGKALQELVAANAHQQDSYHRNPYPCPRMTARWRLPLSEEILDATIAPDGLATIRLAGGGRIRCFVHANQNVVILEQDTPGAAPTLEAILEPEIIPAAETGREEDCHWLVQKLPDDLDVPGITFAAAAVGKEGRYVLAQVTNLESDTPRKAAIDKARQALAIDAAESLQQHQAWWRDYWSRSAISLDDKDLEMLWYRQLYFMGATIRAGKASPGLFAPLTNNQPAWHGDYHTNYNIQQTYWSALAANHADMLEPYNRLIAQYLPRAQWLARKIYGVPGAFYPHVIMYREPADPETCKAVNNRQYLHIEWAYTLGVTSFTVQNLWWRYQYQPDRGYLERVAYPVIAETARFYESLLQQYRDEDGKSRPPTVSPEHWGWTSNLRKNRNCTFDTALIAFNLKAATEAAAILGRDAADSAKWIKALDLLPDYPRHTGDDTRIVDVENAAPIQYNIPIPSTVVFPGDQLTHFSPSADKDIFTHTIAVMDSNGNNDMVINSIARARLSMPDAYEYLRRESLARLRPNGTLTLNRNEPQYRFNTFGHYTEMYGAAAAVSELLMQSVGGIIRVFPAWPQGKPAAFTQLRAIGGFLVTAQTDGTTIGPITIQSTAGGPCAIQLPWPKANLGTETLPPDAQGIVHFETQAGEEYVLSEAGLK
ncbi:MAG: hypothetical protein GWP08_16675 [Nitrospiraceae bacterium]|nr:hypothetical protein [Nitrospiraceae bacterium]